MLGKSAHFDLKPIVNSEFHKMCGFFFSKNENLDNHLHDLNW